MKSIGFFFASLILISDVPAHDIVLRDQNVVVLGISYPSAWKQVIENFSITATREDGKVWSMIRPLEGVQNQAAGIQKIKAGLDQYLTEIQYEDATKTNQGVTILSGTGQMKESGEQVGFTSRLFFSGQRHWEILFIHDAKVENELQKTILAICDSIRGAEDFTKKTNDQPSADVDRLYAQPWLVEAIDGVGVVDRSRSTITFAKDGAVSGNASVNRFRGNAKIAAPKLTFGPLATTRRAGPVALMDQERKFLRALESVTNFKIEATGLLSLKNDAGKVAMRLSPIQVANDQTD